MADFDKRSLPAGSVEKKKLATLGVLGAVLLSIGAFHFLKGSPQLASASTTAGEAAAFAHPVLPARTAAQEQAALENDPTAKLLRGSHDFDPSLDTVPRNPFHIDPTWEDALTKREDARAESPRIDNVLSAAPKPLDLAALKLNGTFRQEQHLYAIINGDIYTTGMTVGNARILDITNNQVTLQRADAPNGPKSTLTLDPKLK